MQRDQYKKAVADSLKKKIIAMDAEFQEFGHIVTATQIDQMLALLINKIGTGMTFRLVELMASKAVTDAETFLGPDVFTDSPTPNVQWKELPKEQQYAASLLLGRRPGDRIFPIEFGKALMTIADSLRHKNILQDKPMNRIVIAFVEKERELNITFWQDK